MCLSLRDDTAADDRKITIWGPPGLSEVMSAASQTFLHTSMGATNFREVHHNGQILNDPAIKVDSHQILPLGRGASPAPAPAPAAASHGAPASKRPRLEEGDAVGVGEGVVCYTVTINPPARNIDMVKLKALGIKPGPWLANFKDGKSLTLPSGETVEPDAVLGPLSDPYQFAIVNCPDLRCVRARALSPRRIRRMRGVSIWTRPPFQPPVHLALSSDRLP
jgi:ribonuclease BN (tRNA processing enzyme)